METRTANPQGLPLLAAALLLACFPVNACGSGSLATGKPGRFPGESLTRTRFEILRSLDRSPRVDVHDLSFHHEEDAGTLHAYVDLFTIQGAIDFIPEKAQEFDALSAEARQEYLRLIAREIETRLSLRFGNVAAVLVVHFRDFRRPMPTTGEARPVEFATYGRGTLREE